MRLAFVNTLIEAAEKDKRIILLTADLGYSVFEEFIKRFPRQFVNVGVSEQNMTGLSAGLAMEGKIPIIYSIIPFVTMRNFEQIRNDICYQNLNVKIVGVGSGFSYGPYGHTHHGLEDVGILRTLANITIMAPGDPLEAKICTNSALGEIGPYYIRLGRAGEPKVHEKQTATIMNGLSVATYGNDFCLLASGTMLHTGKLVVDALNKKGIAGALISVPVIKPFPSKLIKRIVEQTGIVFTLEEHVLIGGLGSAVADEIAEKGYRVRFKKFGVQDRFTKKIGDQEYMREENMLGSRQVEKEILSIVKRRVK